MLPIVRKNIVTFSSVFTASDGTTTQPTAVYAVLVYKDLSGVTHTTDVALTFTNGTWIGEWDSSAAGDGTVFWMIYGQGTLQAASQGCFEIEANPANTA